VSGLKDKDCRWCGKRFAPSNGRHANCSRRCTVLKAEANRVVKERERRHELGRLRKFEGRCLEIVASFVGPCQVALLAVLDELGDDRPASCQIDERCGRKFGHPGDCK